MPLIPLSGTLGYLGVLSIPVSPWVVVTVVLRVPGLSVLSSTVLPMEVPKVALIPGQVITVVFSLWSRRSV